MKRLIPLFLLAGLTFSPATVWARPFPREGMPRLEDRKGRLISELNLSEQQQQQLEAIRQQFRPEVEKLKNKLDQLRQDMRQLNSSNASDQQLRAKFQEIQAVKNDLEELRFEQKLAMRQVLTPEQRVKMANLREGRPRANRF
ncbi:MAG: hypothetical protein CV045_05025 [Cyanobacteria bacterium M5B4]|nr:MAG: hypothetical protein CV045_05025 [Cyanobacteria bacterium M5B4]